VLLRVLLVVCLFGGLLYPLALSSRAQEPSPAPTLEAPADGATLVDQPTFRWSLSAQGTVRLEVATDPDFAQLAIAVRTDESSYSHLSALDPTLTYWWRVGLLGESGETDWSPAWRFSFAPPTPTAEPTPTELPPTSTPELAPTETATVPVATSTPPPTTRPATTPTPTPRAAQSASTSSASGPSAVQVADAELSGTLTPTTGMWVTGASRSSGSQTSMNVVDRDLGTIWTSPGTRPSTAFVMIQLDTGRTIGRIRWLWGQTGYADRVQIEVSRDKTTWTRVATVRNARVGTWQGLDVQRKVRYIRFTFENPNRDPWVGGLAEVEVYSAASILPVVTSIATGTPTNTPTATASPTEGTTTPEAATPTETPTETGDGTPTGTEGTPAGSPTPSPTPKATATGTSTSTPTATATSTSTPIPTATPSPTPSPTPQADGIVTNASFERGKSPWYTEDYANVTNEASHGGAYSMGLNPTGGYAGERILLGTTNIYELRGWGKLSQPFDVGYLGVTFQDANGTRLRDLEPRMIEFTATTFETKSLRFSVPPQVARVFLSIYKGRGDAAYYVDDLSIRVVTSPTPTPSPPAVGCQRLMMPGYFHPDTGYWNEALSTGSGLGIVIVNPNSGVDVRYDPVWDAPIAQARARGFTVLGYIATGFGRRSASSVIEEINRYVEWYGIRDFFLDEATVAYSSVETYRPMVDYIHRIGGIAMLNFGDHPHPAYMQFTDIANVFEYYADDYVNRYQPPAWYADYPPSRFSHIVFNVPPDQMSEILQLSRERNTAYVWLTDEQFENVVLYKRLPPFWTEINEAVQSGCT
jgi:hypothetical protein